MILLPEIGFHHNGRANFREQDLLKLTGSKPVDYVLKSGN